MHMQGEPRTMQEAPRYDDVVAEVSAFLRSAHRSVPRRGHRRGRASAVDPGFGFGKTLAHNLALLASARACARSACRLLVGLSRKSMLGKLIGRPSRAHWRAASRWRPWRC